MVPSIPDRWTDYKPVGRRIEGTRFIAFKVPLKEEVSKNVDSDIRLDDKLLLKMIPNLGLIIDLTNTHRYYDPKIFLTKGIKHIKLMIPGRKTPPKHLADQFNEIVKEFVESNAGDDKLIGVHCTHGVNRTGFFICNYMISQMTIEPNEALNRFSNARGYKIERSNYIDALHKLPETKVENWRDRNPQNWSDRNPQNWRDRNPQNLYPDMSRDGRLDHEDSINYYRDQHIYIRSQNNYDSRCNNYRERSRSPPPFYRRNNTSNDYFSYRPRADQFARRPTSGQGQLARPYFNSYQPPRLRLDYYNTRPSDKSEMKRRQKDF